jgi:hypothetical protein
MNIKFAVSLECPADLDQTELEHEVKVALESSFLFDMGVEKVEITKQEIP